MWEKDGTSFCIYNLEKRGQLGFVFTCKDKKIWLMYDFWGEYPCNWCVCVKC